MQPIAHNRFSGGKKTTTYGLISQESMNDQAQSLQVTCLSHTAAKLVLNPVFSVWVLCILHCLKRKEVLKAMSLSNMSYNSL